MHEDIAYITVGFLDTEGNPSPDLRCIVVDNPKEMARLSESHLLDRVSYDFTVRGD
jgi:hypothetical protein